MLCKVDRQFFPAVTDVAAESAWFVLWLLVCVFTALFYNRPYVISVAARKWILVGCTTWTLSWLSNLMLSNKMLHKIVFSVASMRTVADLARPVLQLSMAFVLMSDPISLALERFRLATARECACERLNVLMNMLRPIRGLIKLLYLEA
jgi:hypothetical protein